MKSKIADMSIVKKMVLSFVLIITIIIGIIMYSVYFTAGMRGEHAYLLTYVMERNRLLIELQNEFRAFGATISASFNNQDWLETATVANILQTQADMTENVEDIVFIVAQYIHLLESDPVANDVMGIDMITPTIETINHVLENILFMLGYYQIENPANIPDNAYFTDVLATYATPNINAIEGLRQLNLDLITTVSSNLYNQQDLYFRFNLMALALIISVAFATIWLMISTFKKRITLIATRAKLLEWGDFNVDMHDEIGDEIGQLTNIMGDIVDIFKNLVEQITIVSTKISEGDINARLNEDIFKGGFQNAAFAINMLAEEVRQVSNLKAEKDYYEYIQFMMDTVPLAITFWDSDFNLTSCNEEIKRRYGLEDKREYMENFYRFSPKYQPDGSLSSERGLLYVQEAFEKSSLTFDWLHQDIHGNQIPSKIICYKAYIKGNPVLCTYASDMRNFYRAIEEMKRSALAEEASEAKTRFLAKMSHEIRTPISAVLGISEIQLKNPDLPLSVEEAFAKIYSSSQLLLGIINDVLDLSKIEANKMAILQDEYEATSLINDIIQLNIFRLGSKKIKFNIDIDPQIPTVMLGDELRIKQIMNNLLSNAFKYTKHGFVFLSVKFLAEGDETFLEFIVEDTGIGMTEENLKALFDEFVRFNEEKNKTIEGVGLGMSIVNNLLSLMNATIDVTSEIDKGSKFIVKIPQERISLENIGEEMVDNLKNFKLSNRFSAKNMTFTPDPMPYGKVLVVDDVETNLFVAKGLLSFYDLTVTTVSSGFEALDLVEEGNTYDIIFLDHMMPQMDGIETINEIHKTGYNHPIVALTANALIGQSEMFLQNGFDGFISKPIDTSHLNSILNKFIRDKQPVEVVEAARRNAENINKERQTKEGMWEFFSGNNKTEASSEFIKGLNKEFARTQKDVVASIRTALEENDITACRRSVHTLKGLARTIGKNDLAEVAGQLETIFERNTFSEDENESLKITNLLKALERRLAETIKSIPLEDLQETAAPTADILSILNDLETLLNESSTASLTTATELNGWPQAAVMLRQIENYDFDAALTTLKILKEIAA
ncbi:MAG: ATP-binding protein [Turicibacter sp.]|nr:ATP-binding protein [Turicibacter sp.]